MRIEVNTNQPVYTLNSCFKASKTEAKEGDAIPNKPKRIISPSAITIATLASVASIVMLSRGFQKNANKYLNRFKDYLGRKQEKSFLQDSNQKAKFYEFSIRRVNSFIKKTESLNNITSAKDILFMKLMYKSEPTKKIHQSITEYFEKLSRKTVLDSYKRTANNFDSMNKTFDKLDELIIKNSGEEVVEFKGKKYTKKELVKLAKDYRETANIVLTSFMSEESMKTRYKYINDVTDTLYSRFWEASFKDFWSKNNKFKRKEMWQTFIAAEQIKGNKTQLAEWSAIARNALTYNNTDRSEQIYSYIKKLDGIIPLNDKTGMDILERIEWFTKHPEAFKDNKELFLKELGKLQSHKINAPDENLAKTQEQTKQSYIKIIRELSDEHATGFIQDMLSIYYKISPYELEKSGASMAVKKAVESFDKSVDYECVEFFDKVRDLKLGSAPTDVLTIIFSFIALTSGLGYAKNKDSRTSIMLKSGIPLVGGIAATMYSATKLVSGGKSLLFGFLSGIVLNQIGKVADAIRNNKRGSNDALHSPVISES